MIKLKPLIQNESISTFNPTVGKRAIAIEKEKGNSLLDTSFNKFNQYSFFRSTKSMSRFDNHDLLVVPRKIERASKDTANFYYVLFDNLPSWKGFPSRSKSIIFTNSSSIADEYSGALCRVHPINNAKIAFGYYNDFLELKHVFHRWGCRIIPELMTLTSRFFNKINEMYKSLTLIPNIYDLENSEYQSFLKLIDDNATNEVVRKIYDISDQSALTVVLEDILENKKGNWEEYFSELYHPQKNEIYLLNDAGFNPKSKYEFWTDGACLLRTVFLDN